MKRAQHATEHPVTCPACITLAETARMPWESDYIHHIGTHETEYLPRHRAALARRARAQAYRDCGLTRVKGALGGTYWE